QVFLLLLLGTTAKDQLGGDLRARAQRTHTDVGARELLGDDAHRLLAETHSAEGLGDGQAKDPKLAKLGDHLLGDVLVVEMPGVAMRRDFAERKASHLPPHGLEGFVVSGGPKARGIPTIGDELSKPRFQGGIAASIDEFAHLLLEAMDFWARNAERRE